MEARRPNRGVASEPTEVWIRANALRRQPLFVSCEARSRGDRHVNSAELARQFNLPGVLRFADTPGGLVRGIISSPAAEAEIYLQGAHVARWKPHGHRPAFSQLEEPVYAWEGHSRRSTSYFSLVRTARTG